MSRPGVGAILAGLSSEAGREDPYPLYAALRARAPVVRSDEHGGWLVSRHADVRAALEDPGRFSSRIMEPADRTLLGADPPEHTERRRVVGRMFARVCGESLVPELHEVVGDVAAGLRGRETWDLVSEVATPVALRVTARLLGLDQSNPSELALWSTAILRASREGTRNDPELVATLRTLDGRLRELVMSTEGGSDLFRGLHAESLLTVEQRVSFARLLVTAGTETTINLTGNMMAALLEHPHQWERVCGDPSLLPGAVREAARYDNPVQHVLRGTTERVSLGGARIPGGGVVLLLIGSANRDERVYERPDAFDLERTGRHLGFGRGPHHCLGSSLAAATIRCIFETLIGEWPVERARVVHGERRFAARQLRGFRRLVLGFPGG